jgi:hypothetical protein
MDNKGIEWHGKGMKKWAYGCEFPGNNVMNVETELDQCGRTCEKYTICTHFTWSEGVCYIKHDRYGFKTTGEAVPSKDDDIICGTVSNYVYGNHQSILLGRLKKVI